MKILATDLDRTLLPNGHWQGDSNAIELFNQLTVEHDTLVVYVTGRNLDLTEKAIATFGVRYPDYLCGDVGTTIRKYESGQWAFDPGWVPHVKKQSPRWNADAIRDDVAEVKGIRLQEAEHLNAFKLSYYADHKQKEAIVADIEKRIKGRYDEVIVYSYDSQDDNGLIDFLPASATKQTALEYVAAAHNVPKGEVVFCGDSGNDIFPLTAGFQGVLVRNADDQLVAKVKEAMNWDPELKAYFAKGGFKGLSGYYTSGVIEGAYHYGLFNKPLPEKS
jgi:HAD superfamily hydrolase (TIGR01484 family)